jgi:hypothetical protein
MPAKKKKPELVRKLREGGYLFHVCPQETEVFLGRRSIGTIVGMKEQSGRHCFRLACDSRREPRTYRGRVQAAQALQMIDDLKRQAKQGHWSIDEMIVRSWDDKPRASQAMDAE